MTSPSIRTSVVVATHQRRAQLGLLLDALEAQEGLSPQEWEVVVVDDGSTDGTGDLLHNRRQTTSLNLEIRRREQANGPAAARNEGWRAAQGDVVLFTDDDCRPAPGWVRALRDVMADPAVGLAQGRTQPAPGEWEGSGPFARTIRVVEEDGYYATCNMAYRRALLDELGGFDETFGTVAGRPVWGEDTDLALRAIEAGAGTAFSAGAVVHHAVSESDYPAYLRERLRRESLVLVARRHPQLRSRFHDRYWYEGSHAPALLAAAGLAATVIGLAAGRRRGVAGLALAAPYVRYRLQEERRLPSRPVNQPAVIALGLVADLVEVAVLARGSLRYGTLLL